ncbi:MAG TPA: Hsp20/alpha crystallin family protein [Dehalococcoidia bacterium]|jgi:HSP20 family protein|nr:Hsp20/alpha crystallin family protein [Dehalococcoidia bacterium]
MADMQSIPVKMYRSEGRLTLAAPMPGLEPDDVKVEIAADKIVLHGDLRGTLKGDKEAVMDEWTPGPYHREVQLPEGVDGEMANLTYNNGVLVLVMPRAQKTKPAMLTLDEVSPTQGERIGNAGRPVRKAS